MFLIFRHWSPWARLNILNASLFYSFQFNVTTTINHHQLNIRAAVKEVLVYLMKWQCSIVKDSRIKFLQLWKYDSIIQPLFCQTKNNCMQYLEWPLDAAAMSQSRLTSIFKRFTPNINMFTAWYEIQFRAYLFIHDNLSEIIWRFSKIRGRGCFEWQVWAPPCLGWSWALLRWGEPELLHWVSKLSKHIFLFTLNQKKIFKCATAFTWVKPRHLLEHRLQPGGRPLGLGWNLTVCGKLSRPFFSCHRAVEQHSPLLSICVWLHNHCLPAPVRAETEKQDSTWRMKELEMMLNTMKERKR